MYLDTELVNLVRAGKKKNSGIAKIKKRNRNSSKIRNIFWTGSFLYAR